MRRFSIGVIAGLLMVGLVAAPANGKKPLRGDPVRVHPQLLAESDSLLLDIGAGTRRSAVRPRRPVL